MAAGFWFGAGFGGLVCAGETDQTQRNATAAHPHFFKDVAIIRIGNSDSALWVKAGSRPALRDFPPGPKTMAPTENGALPIQFCDLPRLR